MEPSEQISCMSIADNLPEDIIVRIANKDLFVAGKLASTCKDFRRICSRSDHKKQATFSRANDIKDHFPSTLADDKALQQLLANSTGNITKIWRARQRLVAGEASCFDLLVQKWNSWVSSISAAMLYGDTIKLSQNVEDIETSMLLLCSAVAGNNEKNVHEVLKAMDSDILITAEAVEVVLKFPASKKVFQKVFSRPMEDGMDIIQINFLCDAVRDNRNKNALIVFCCHPDFAVKNIPEEPNTKVALSRRQGAFQATEEGERAIDRFDEEDICNALCREFVPL